MTKELGKWIAESESWQSFIDFKLSADPRVQYNFTIRSDDFYLSLMNGCFKALRANSNTDELLLLAKGLEIYSLENKREYFTGIDNADNMLYAAGLYFLADYTTSALLLSKLYSKENYKSEYNDFIVNILHKDLKGNNNYTKQIRSFFETGDISLINKLKSIFSKNENEAFNNGADEYASFLLANAILSKLAENNIWVDLLAVNAKVDYWKPCVFQIFNRSTPILNFFPSQREAIKSGVLSDKTVSLQMPTSAGKTFLTEIVIYNEIMKEKTNKVLYLAPYRALAGELRRTLGKSMQSLKISCRTIYGGNLPSIDERQDIVDASVLISTPEKFIAIENIYPGLANQYTTIICDEGHLLEDDTRGFEYELLLSSLKVRLINTRFVFISAVIPNIATINRWLGGENVITSDYRPTQLDFAFMKKRLNSNNFYLDINPATNNNYQLDNFLDNNDLNLEMNDVKYKIKTNKALSVAAALKASIAGNVLLFAPQKGEPSGVEPLVKELIKQLSLRTDISLLNDFNNDNVSDLLAYFLVIFGRDFLLYKAASNGFLYHHGDFPQFIREIIEECVNEGKIRIVVCTTTLAEGVNLPIRTIVIHSTKRYDRIFNKLVSLKQRDLKNLIGRAGRAGKETKGIIIIPNSSDFPVMQDVMKDTNIGEVKGQFYNLVKSLTDRLLARNLTLTDELLNQLEIENPELVVAIDMTLLEMLAEDVKIEELYDIVNKIVENTFSYSQSDIKQRETLVSIFNYRVNKYQPYIASKDFKEMKASNTPLSIYEDIIKTIDMDNAVWTTNFEPLDENWLVFILDNGLFRLVSFTNKIRDIKINRVPITLDTLKDMIIMWMEGAWYNGIANSCNTEISEILAVINKVFSFYIQTILASIIRLVEIRNYTVQISPAVINWPKMLEYGFNSQLKLDLFEMGITDREAVLWFAAYLTSMNYQHIDKEGLIKYLHDNILNLRNIPHGNIPNISFRKIINFLDSLEAHNA